MCEKPGYDVKIHTRARKELDSITSENGDELRQRLKELEHYESPTSATFAKQMEDHINLFTVRVEGFRALCTFSKPTIYVLLIDKRRNVYSRISVAEKRGALV